MLTCWETETPQKSLYVMKQNFLIFQEIGTVKKLFTFQEIELSELKKKMKKTTLKKCFFISEGSSKAPKNQNLFYFFKESYE